jgi:histone H3/H4
MTLPSKKSEVVDEISDGVEHFLKNVDSGPFSPPAFTVLKGVIAQYISDLVNESGDVANREHVDTISAKHVELARERLTLRAGSKVYKLAATIGGLGLGTCLSTICAMMLVWQFPVAGIVICTFSGTVGGFLLALSIGRD